MAVLRLRVFNLMQYEYHPITGEPLLSVETIEKALAHKSIKQWAWIAHDQDVYTEADEIDERVPEGKHAGDLKPRHFHVVGKCPNAVELEALARWFGVPEQYIEKPTGRAAFEDCVEYLTHESAKEQAAGKALYPDELVKANFPWREMLDARTARKMEYGGHDLDPRDAQRYEVMYKGKTLRQCYDQDSVLYMNDVEKLTKLRLEYIAHQQPPRTRTNYYICGNGGVGKGLASRALARALFPDLVDEDCYYELGAEDVTFEGYDGQPVIIWHDCRAKDLLKRLKSRGNVFNVFDPIPSRGRQNIKYGSVNLINEVNIVNSVQPYHDFLDGLVAGTAREADEDKAQSYRRFPFIIPLREEEFDYLINKGFYEGQGYVDEWIEYQGIQGNFARLHKAMGDNPNVRIYEGKLMELPAMAHEQNKRLAEAKGDVDLTQFEHYGEVRELGRRKIEGEQIEVEGSAS